MTTTYARLPLLSCPAPRLAPDVILVDVPDGSARLLDLNGQFHALSEIAALMLRETLAHGKARAAETVAARYAADLDLVSADLEKFLGELQRQGLLVETGETELVRKGGFVAKCVLGLLLRLNRWLRPTQAGKASGMLALASLSCRWLGWARTVEMWQKNFPAAAPLADHDTAKTIAKKIDDLVRRALATLTVGTACKERGLTCWALARRAGLPATMMVGVSLYPLNAHCWTVLGETPLADEPERCQQYQPVIRYA